MDMFKWLYFSGIMLSALLSLSTHAYPVTVDNCGEALTIDAPPQRAVIHDINMSEMAFALDLHAQIAGVTGISGWYKLTPEFMAKKGDIPELAAKYPTLETLLLAKTDFFFAGWNYGIKVGGELTPAILAQHGIPTLLLSESCIHQGVQREASMDLLYDDILKLGLIFNQTEKAQSLVNDWKNQLSAIQQQLPTNSAHQPRIFLYDSGQDKPFTAGQYSIIHALIGAAQARHVMQDLPTSWGTVSWESVALANPDWMILLDYGDGLEAKIAFLQQHPLMSQVTAVKQQNYIYLRYEEITPGPANITAIKKMVSQLYPHVSQ